MSINWVMLSNGTFTPLPGEQTLYTSPPRVALSISVPTHYPGRQQQSFSVSSSSGLIYLTNRRLIYLPAQSTDKLQSFATPFLNLHDSHVTAPFFGPNIWQALLQPVGDGGIPAPATGVVELKLTFKDGGAFDFHSKFEQLKERAQHLQETSRMAGVGDARLIDLEDLPVYQEQNDGPLIPPIAPTTAAYPAAHTSSQSDEPQRTIPPSEPPPSYEA
ncbi:hypothetical protein AMS68_004943 [Peltaster fructicola]|uniref:GRAM domain-containing protein n=1 Tax=Peltaster fructicola TaxID=286661 RepID=A0A6H0XXL6_9PEZI|nr:hypothetical protein AMS68_004943 [Peltaster fructicola]